MTPTPERKGDTIMLIRQGDVLLVPAAKPDGARKVERDDTGRLVLAEGEATGHAHAITDPGCDLVTDEQTDELFLLVYGDDVRLLHEEHDTLFVPPGAWRVTRQREYTPAAPVWVAD